MVEDGIPGEWGYVAGSNQRPSSFLFPPSPPGQARDAIQFNGLLIERAGCLLGINCVSERFDGRCFRDINMDRLPTHAPTLKYMSASPPAWRGGMF